jgi:hypothetical protein
LLKNSNDIPIGDKINCTQRKGDAEKDSLPVSYAPQREINFSNGFVPGCMSLSKNDQQSAKSK